MDTVTESQRAIYMTKFGCIGMIHKNMSIKMQSIDIEKVKACIVDEREYPDASRDKKRKIISWCRHWHYR